MAVVKDKIKLESVTKILKFRYVCDACTGRAVYAAEPYDCSGEACGNCGKPVINYKGGNWIKVTDKKELKEINES